MKVRSEMREDVYFPGRLRHAEVDDRKERFAALNEYVPARQGWLTSIAGDRVVTMEWNVCPAQPCRMISARSATSPLARPAKASASWPARSSRSWSPVRTASWSR
jgi:hypothetical protein